MCIQAIEANKASWGSLFEPFPFFEAYKNYLRIDIATESDDDMRQWKGWVESRIRLLTLKVMFLSSASHFDGFTAIASPKELIVQAFLLLFI